MAFVSRREFLKISAAGYAALLVGPGCFKTSRRPNIIYILADDLGYGELGCYGQTKIRTPNINRLAAEGKKFTQHYAGSPVCAPSRCTLLTGKHTGHSYIRDNDEMRERGDVWHDPALQGQRPLLDGTETIGTMLQNAGYTTGCVGKWGLGGPDSSGHPNRQGFDFFYGYLCQRIAHNYYPAHLWKNEKQILLNNNDFFPHQKFPADKNPNDSSAYASYSGNDYAPDRMTDEALGFIRANVEKPFFLYYASPIPHVSLQVPDDSLKEYLGKFEEKPYLGNQGYLPHQYPRSCYAAMISRLDRDVGRILSLLKELQLDDNTLVIFSSDNGASFNGGMDREFFKSNSPLKGGKCEAYEGGIRVPMIARWPGVIHPGSVSNHISAFWDVMPTLAEVSGGRCPEDIDGISLLPILKGDRKPEEHDHLYWEYFGRPAQAVRMKQWKGIRRYNRELNPQPFELYNLEKDLGETTNVAKDHPDVVKRILHVMDAREPSFHPDWNFKKRDG